MFLCALAALAPPTFRIELTDTKGAYHVHERAALRAEAVNGSRSTIAFVKAGIDTMAEIRAPYWHLERRRDDGGWEAVSTFLGLCGNSDFSVHRESFVLVPPGASKPLSDYDGNLAVALQETMSEPGAYTIRLVYDSRPEPEKWMGVNGAV